MATSAMPPTLNDEQVRAWKLAMDDHSVFLTGRAGCGKSFLVRALVAALRSHSGLSVAVVASTGIAASHIGGVTLHSFAGIGMGKQGCGELVDRVRSNRKAAARWRATDVIVIDEVSMVSSALMDTLDNIARSLRGDAQVPWGGMRVIAVGDFFQLGPIGKGAKYAFEAECWSKLFPPHHVVHLRSQMRQHTDTTFAKILASMRIGRLTDAMRTTLLHAAGAGLPRLESCGIQPTKLFPHNADVDKVNAAALDALPGPQYHFGAIDKGDSARHLKSLKSACRAAESLRLKLGAQVMLLRNLDCKQGLVNGARGVVVDFVQRQRRARGGGSGRKGDTHTIPVVQFTSGLVHEVPPTVWEVHEGDLVVAARIQVPLRLAYAITIHKSQGMTIDALEVDLGRVFASGHAYVALSRAVSLDAVRVVNLTKASVKANSRVMNYYVATAEAFHAHKATKRGAEDVG